MQYKIIVTLAPELEEDIVNNLRIESYFDFFCKLYDLSKQLKHILVVLLPNDLLGFFYSSMIMKNLLVRIKDVGSNIIFTPLSGIECDLVLENKGRQYSNLKTLKIIGSSVRKYYLPLLVGISSNSYVKRECLSLNTNCTEHFCIDEAIISSSVIHQYIDLIDNLNKCCITNTKNWILKKDSLDSSDIKRIAILLAFVRGATSSEIEKIKPIHVIKQFINDIKTLSDEDLVKAAFSIFRAIAYPSAKTRERGALSIDWHPNNPAKEGEYFLFRIDVAAPEKSGISASGTHRILMAKKDSNIYIVAYTNTHNFSNDLIQQRVKMIKMGTI